ncbi:MAG: hypothetical protein ACR5K5_04985 [Wolbachia sp.]
MNFSEYTKNNALVMSCTEVNINELIAFLQSNTHITELSLSHCRIGNEGLKALAEGNLKNLTKLDLQVNDIDDEGAKALANGNLKNLTRLNLDYNEISGKGAKALVKGNFTSLTELSLHGNVLFNEADRKILKHNLKNSTLRLVDDNPNCVGMMALLQNATTDLGKVIAGEVGFVQAVDQQQESILGDIAMGIAKTISGRVRNIQATNDQQQESDAQAATSDQPGGKLDEVQPISRSQSPNSPHSNNGDIRKSQRC